MDLNRGSARRLAKLLVAGSLAAAGVQAAQADELRIKMLETSGSGPLAFEPAFVKAKAGDTIVFEPTQKGNHSVVSLLVPAGAQPWEGAPDKEVRIRVDAEGVYLYVCAAHRMMGMVGVILVGNPVNLEDARRVAKQETSKFVLNKDRFDKALAQID